MIQIQKRRRTVVSPPFYIQQQNFDKKGYQCIETLIPLYAII